MRAYKKRSDSDPEPERLKPLHLRVNTTSILQAEIRTALRNQGINVSQDVVFRDPILFKLESYLWRDTLFYSSQELLEDSVCISKAVVKLRDNKDFIDLVAKLEA